MKLCDLIVVPMQLPDRSPKLNKTTGWQMVAQVSFLWLIKSSFVYVVKQDSNMGWTSELLYRSWISQNNCESEPAFPLWSWLIKCTLPKKEGRPDLNMSRWSFPYINNSVSNSISLRPEEIKGWKMYLNNWAPSIWKKVFWVWELRNSPGLLLHRNYGNATL